MKKLLVFIIITGGLIYSVYLREAFTSRSSINRRLLNSCLKSYDISVNLQGPFKKTMVNQKITSRKIFLIYILQKNLLLWYKTIQNSRQHYWEIYSKNIKSIIRHFDSYHSHSLTRHYRLFERPYSHFFIFERR